MAVATYFHRIKDLAGKKQDEVLAELLEQIESNIGDKLTKRQRRHLFTVITEIVQNVQNYANPDKENYVEIGYDEDQNVVINAKNYCDTKSAEMLNSLIDSMDGASKEELLIKYNELLTESSNEGNSLSGLGVHYVKANSMACRYRVSSNGDDSAEVNLKVLY